MLQDNRESIPSFLTAEGPALRSAYHSSTSNLYSFYLRILGPGKKHREGGDKKKGDDLFSSPFLSKIGGYLLSHFYAVPSAWSGLTSLFGMGRGGPLTL